MEDVPVLVTVRFSSSRLPGKCLLPISNKSVLEHLTDRLKDSELNPVICTSSDSSDDVICDLADRIGISYFRGDLLNKIERWSSAASNLRTKYVHVIDADDPLVDTDQIKLSISKAMERDLDLLRTSPRSDNGFASVGMSVKSKFLNDLAQRTKFLKSKDLDVIPWKLLLTESDRVDELEDNFLFPFDKGDLRLTLDYEEDFLVISKVIEVLGNSASRYEIEEFLYRHPEIVEINAGRAVDFRANKVRQLDENF